MLPLKDILCISKDKIMDKRLVVGKEIARGKESIVYEDKRNINNVIKKCTDLKEFNILKNLQHINIIKPIDWFIDEDELLEIINDEEYEEYEENEKDNLFEYYVVYPRLEKVKKIPTICQIKELVNAIEYLIENNIDHGDLRIDNIMTHNEKLTLIDFGCCNIISHNMNELFMYKYYFLYNRT